jgi:hypothetical protein
LGTVHNTTNAITQYLYGALNPGAGAATINFTWTGGGTFDFEIIPYIFTGVDQTAVGSSFTNFNSGSATLTGNPTLAITASANGYVYAAFATTGSDDLTDTQISAGSVTLFHGNQHSINTNAGGQAEVSSGTITFTGIKSSSTSQGIVSAGINIVPVGGAGTQHPQTLILTSGTFQQVTRTVG